MVIRDRGGGTDGIGVIDAAVRQVVRDAVTEGVADAPMLTEPPRTEEITPPGGPATSRPPGGNSSSSSGLALGPSATETAEAEAIGFTGHTTSKVALPEDERVIDGVPQPRAKSGSRRPWYWDTGAWQAVLSRKKDTLL